MIEDLNMWLLMLKSFLQVWLVLEHWMSLIVYLDVVWLIDLIWVMILESSMWELLIIVWWIDYDLWWDFDRYDLWMSLWMIDWGIVSDIVQLYKVVKFSWDYWNWMESKWLDEWKLMMYDMNYMWCVGIVFSRK